MLRLQAAYWRRQERIAQLAGPETWRGLATALNSGGGAAAGSAAGLVSADEMLRLAGLD